MLWGNCFPKKPLDVIVNGRSKEKSVFYAVDSGVDCVGVFWLCGADVGVESCKCCGNECDVAWSCVVGTVSHEGIEEYAFVESDVAILGKSYYVTLEGLNRETQYFFRAVGELQTAGAPKLYVGAESTFKPGWPSLSTGGPTEVTTSSAQINGHLGHMGGASECSVWFEWGLSRDVLDEQTSVQVVEQLGWFNDSLSSLELGTTYYYRAAASNDLGDVRYGAIDQVTGGAAEVETRFATDIQDVSAVGNARLVHLGGMESAEVWFEYGADPDNLDKQTAAQTLTGAGLFSSELFDLQPETTYWFRAVADNGLGVSHGDLLWFTTSSGKLSSFCVFVQTLSAVFDEV